VIGTVIGGLMSLGVKGTPYTPPEATTKLNKGIDFMVSMVDNQPEILDYILDNGIPQVRLHVYIKATKVQDDVSATEALQLNFDWIDQILEKFGSKVKSYITIADFPIGDNGDTTCDDKLDPAYWDNTDCLDQIVSLSCDMLDKYKNSANVLGYQFLGEPVTIIDGKTVLPTQWRDTFQRIIDYRDSIGCTQVLTYSGTPWGMCYRYDYEPFDADNMIYNLHFYFPLSYTHQRINSSNTTEYFYPDDYDDIYWDIDRIRDVLQEAKDFETNNNVEMIVSEFGCALWADNSVQYLEDLITVFNENGWKWFAFNIGERFYKGWDARYTVEVDEDNNKTYTLEDNNKIDMLLAKVKE